MENDKEKWINDVFESFKGSERARPGSGLFARIEGQINSQEANIIPMRQWRMIAAAAVLLLAINVLALQQFSKESTADTNDLVMESTTNYPLLSNYKIYEE